MHFGPARTVFLKVNDSLSGWEVLGASATREDEDAADRLNIYPQPSDDFDPFLFSFTAGCTSAVHITYCYHIHISRGDPYISKLSHIYR